MSSTIGPSMALAMAATVLRPKQGDGISDEKWQALQDKAASDQEALDKLALARKQQRSSRKGDSRQRLEQIKQRIEMLKRMGINSPGAARELARLARELKGAAREYRQTGAASDITTSTTTPESQAAERKAEGEADKDFSNEVRKIAQLLKAMIKKAKPDKNSDEERGLEQARKDLKEAVNDANAIFDQAGGGNSIDPGGILV